MFSIDEVSTATVTVPIKNDIPSNFEHVSEKTRDDISILGFLFKIRNKFEVRAIFCLVGCSCESDVDMLPSDPLIEIVFNLIALLAGL